MKQRMIYSSCPHCGHDFQILRDTYEIANMNPIAEKRLQDESYFLHQCNKCLNLYYLQFPFIYRNPKKKYVILLSQQDTLPAFPKDERVIRLKHAKQFSFVYKVLKYELDIKEVFSIYQRVKSKFGLKTKFDSYQEGKLWFSIQGEYVAVPYDKG